MLMPLLVSKDGILVSYFLAKMVQQSFCKWQKLAMFIVFDNVSDCDDNIHNDLTVINCHNQIKSIAYIVSNKILLWFACKQMDQLMDTEAIELEEQSNGMCVANFVRSFACCLYCKF